jgi:hypothetical protein
MNKEFSYQQFVRNCARGTICVVRKKGGREDDKQFDMKESKMEFDEQSKREAEVSLTNF